MLPPLRRAPFRVWLLAAATLAASARSAAALETDILFGAGNVKPNVLLLFDNSGSMNNQPTYDPDTTYSGSYAPTTIYHRCQQYNSNCTCKKTQTSWVVHAGQCGWVDANNDGVDDRTSYKQKGNRRNYETGSPNKITIAKSVITSLLNDPANADVRFGLMVYNGNYNINGGNFNDPQHFANYHTDTTIMKSPVQDNNQANLISIINALSANGGTPSANRMIAAGKYFEGTFASYSSPIQYACQGNYIVNITDGIPEGEGNSLNANNTGQYPYIESWLTAWLGADIDPDDDGRDPDPTNVYINGGSDYMDDVAWVLQHQDLKPSVDGQQSITTFTIGFDVSHQLLADTAANGGGRYFTASTADELADALRRTMNLIITDAQSFVAPVVPVNALKRTQSGDRLYIALFQPLQASNFWAGNIKKYGIDTDGDLTSPDGSPATNASGTVLSTASSYFDTSPSGGAVKKGGVGERLLARSSARNIHTYLGDADLTAASNAFLTGNAGITTVTLSVPDVATRDAVIKYVRGEDVYDDDEDDNVTEKRDWILGDFIHSTPLVVTYGSSDRVIVAGANDGQLHAFDDSSGEEIWAFIPPAVLPRLKELVPGGAAFHPFLVDGSPKLLVTDSDQKILIFGLRRGGSYYYALDISTKTAPRFLWEIGAGTGGMSELGQAWSEPLLGKVGDGSSFTYVALFGAGYDTYFDDPSKSSANPSNPVGRGVFMVNALTGAVLQAIRPPGMSYPVPSNISAVDTNHDDTYDLAYFGDLGGNLWRWELPATLTRVFSTSGHKIFFAPDLVRDQGYLAVFFGTGDLAGPLETSSSDRLLAFHDDGLSGNYTEANLVDVTGNLVQDGSAAQQSLVRDQLAAGKGWYIRLERPGEKALASPLAFFNVFFTTFTPTAAVCSGGGDASLYVIGFEDGRASSDVNADGTVSKADRSKAIGSSIPTEVTATIREEDAVGYIGVGGAIPKVDLPGPPLNVIPLSWREVY